MRFGLYEPLTATTPPNAGLAVRAALERARRAEQVGFEELWVPDHRATLRAAWWLLGVVGERAPRLRPGVVIIGGSGATRRPRVLAVRALASAVNGGRTSVGVFASPEAISTIAWAAQQGITVLCPWTARPRDALAVLRRYRDELEHAPPMGQRNGGVALVRRALLAETDAEALRRAGLRRTAVAGDPSGPLVGAPETVAAQLAHLERELGELTILLDFVSGGVPAEQALASLERFGRELLPRFRPQPLPPLSFA